MINLPLGDNLIRVFDKNKRFLGIYCRPCGLIGIGLVCHDTGSKSQTQKDKEKLEGEVLVKNIGGHQTAETG